MIYGLRCCQGDLSKTDLAVILLKNLWCFSFADYNLNFWKHVRLLSFGTMRSSQIRFLPTYYMFVGVFFKFCGLSSWPCLKCFVPLFSSWQDEISLRPPHLIPPSNLFSAYLPCQMDCALLKRKDSPVYLCSHNLFTDFFLTACCVPVC